MVLQYRGYLSVPSQALWASDPDVLQLTPFLETRSGRCCIAVSLSGKSHNPLPSLRHSLPPMTGSQRLSKPDPVASWNRVHGPIHAPEPSVGSVTVSLWDTAQFCSFLFLWEYSINRLCTTNLCIKFCLQRIWSESMGLIIYCCE